MDTTNSLQHGTDPNAAGEITQDELESVAGGNPILVGVAVAAIVNVLTNADAAIQAVKDGWNSV